MRKISLIILFLFLAVQIKSEITELVTLKVIDGRGVRAVRIPKMIKGMTFEDQIACAFMTGLLQRGENMVFIGIRHRDVTYHIIHGFHFVRKFRLKCGDSEEKWGYAVHCEVDTDTGGSKKELFVLRFLTKPRLRLLTFVHSDSSITSLVMGKNMFDGDEQKLDSRINEEWNFKYEIIDYADVVE